MLHDLERGAHRADEPRPDDVAIAARVVLPEVIDPYLQRTNNGGSEPLSCLADARRLSSSGPPLIS